MKELHELKIFDDLPEAVQNDLFEWVNRRPSEKDKENLLSLFKARWFRAWNCPECETRVYECTMPHFAPFWKCFQGVRQIDRASYPTENVRSLSEVDNDIEATYPPREFDRFYREDLCDGCRKKGWIA